MVDLNDKDDNYIIEISCNDCNHYQLLNYGYGFFIKNFFFYCPECYKIQRYPTKIFNFHDNKERNLDKPAATRVRKCRYCHTKLEPLELESPINSHEVKGPSNLKCSKCKSKNITYYILGGWDPFL